MVDREQQQEAKYALN